jgi:hypothetical protein
MRHSPTYGFVRNALPFVGNEFSSEIQSNLLHYRLQGFWAK